MNKAFLQRTAAFITAILSGVMLFCCCGGDTDVNDDEFPELVIGVDYYVPFVFCDDNGEFAGMDVELAKEVCRHIGYKPKFYHIDWGKKNTYLLRGETDCLWGCFSLTGRENEYSWSLPYMNSREVVGVREDSDIFEISDLENKRIAVQATTKPDEIFSGRAGIRMTVPNIKQVNCFHDMTYIFAAISKGYVDAIAGHETAIREYMKSSSLKLRILDESLLDVQVGVAFLKGTNSDIIEKINRTFLLLRDNGYISKLFASYGLAPEICMVNYEQNK